MSKPAKETLRIVTLTISDTRTAETDEGGRTLKSCLESAGFAVREHHIVRDDVESIREAIRFAAPDCDAILTTGGTGLGPRDVTVAAAEALFTKRMDGFGEQFRRLSWDEVGPRAMLSNATAGLVGTACVFCLPGSPKALPLAIDRLVAPVLVHAVSIARGGGH